MKLGHREPRNRKPPWGAEVRRHAGDSAGEDRLHINGSTGRRIRTELEQLDHMETSRKPLPDPVLLVASGSMELD